MALACDPLLLIADEPTTALDLMVQAQVLALLADLKEERDLTLMFITHDLSVLTYACRRLAVMYAGRIVEEGPAWDVFENAAHPYTRALAAAFPTIGDETSRWRLRASVATRRLPTTFPRAVPSTPGARWPMMPVCRSSPTCVLPVERGVRLACWCEQPGRSGGSARSLRRGPGRRRGIASRLAREVLAWSANRDQARPR